MKKINRKTGRVLCRTASLLLSLLLMASALTVLPAISVSAAGGTASDGKHTLRNVALGQSIAATSSYIAPEGFFNEAFLLDGDWDTYPGRNGNVKLGWNTATAGGPMNEDDPVDLTVTFDDLYTIEQAVIKPMQWNGGAGFPRDYELQVSTDGASWKTVASAKNVDASAKSNTDVKPIEYTFEPVDALYFRLHITRHSASKDASGCFISSIGELEVYGFESPNAEEGEIFMNKYALRMNPGEFDWLYLTNGRKRSAHEVTYESSNTDVVHVSEDGTVISRELGEAVVTITDHTDGKTYTVPVTVDDFKVKEHFQIVAFIPFFYEENINPTTFDNLKKGGITDVELNFALDSKTITYENNLKTIQYCYERGLDCTVSEADFNAVSWPGKSDEQMAEFVKRYSHLPGVTAYYVVDEPANAVPFARAIHQIKSVMPNAVAHVNFCGAYDGIVTALQNELVSKYGESLDYVMYDAYVFRSAVCAESTLWDQLAYNRNIGHRLGVNTATYIQSMAWNNCNRPNADAIRYQVYASLAAGVKQLSYFCWQTPRANQYETYGPAVIDIDGNPTDLFEPVSKINAAVQALGPTLMKLDTEEVYFTGQTFGAGWKDLPAGFFITPVDWEQNLAFSLMQDKVSGHAYSMMVNRDYMKPAKVSFKADESIKTLYYVSTETGELCALTPENGVYTVELQAGEGILLTGDENWHFEPKDITNYYFLEKAYAEAEALDMTKYRKEEQNNFLSALKSVNSLLEKREGGKKFTQNEVDAALKKLQDGISKLRLLAAEGVNIAKGKRVTCNNSYEEGTYFSLNYLTDGINVDLTVNTHQGWSIDPFSGISRNKAVDLTLDLEHDYSISSVVLLPTIYNNGGAMPSDFEIQVSSDKKEWKTVKTVEGLTMETPVSQYYTFDSLVGRYIRIHITKHSAVTDATGCALSQIGEIEVYGAEVGDNPGTDTEPATEPVTDPATEPATEPATDPETNPATEPATEPATVPADTAAESGTAEQGTDAETEPSASGCSSLLASGLAALLCAAAALICVAKRKKY